jgi:hypothetical protein
MAGKGSNRRPIQVPKEQYEKNWERIFGDKLSRKDGQSNEPKNKKSKK